MRNRCQIFVFLSAICHGILILFFFSQQNKVIAARRHFAVELVSPVESQVQATMQSQEPSAVLSHPLAKKQIALRDFVKIDRSIGRLDIWSKGTSRAREAVPGEVESKNLSPPGAARSFAEDVEILSALRALSGRIDERLDFPSELLKTADDAFFVVKMVIEKDGSLLSASVQRDPPSAMQAWVLSKVREALNRPLPAKARAPGQINVRAEFHFENPIRGLNRPTRYPPIRGDMLVFNRSRYNDILSLGSDGDSESDSRGQPGPNPQLELVALFKKLFGGKSEDPTRVFWDLNFRLGEAVRACETGQADRACYISGQIEEVFAHRVAAAKWYGLACAGGHELACQAALSLARK